MVYKWKEEHTPLFLKHYQSLECLWNSDCVDNKNQTKRKQGISTLTQILRDRHNLDVQESDVRLKIKTIRTRYAAEATKIKKAKSCGQKYVPKLFWYKQADAFLRPHFKPKSLAKRNCYIRVSNKKYIPIRNNTTISQTDRDQNEKIRHSLLGKIVKRTEITQDNVEREHDEEDDFNIAHDEVNLEAEITDINIPEEYYEEDTETTKQEHWYGQYMKTTNAIEDEFSLFCRSLAVQLNKMPLARALVCQQKLQDVIVQERLSAMNADPSAGSQETAEMAAQQLSQADYNLNLDKDDPIGVLKAEH